MTKQLGIALGLGLLVGLQRERADSAVAGFRTFPLVTLLGTMCAVLAASFGGWVVGAGLIAVCALAVLGNVLEMKSGRVDPGVTTEVALLVMFGVGVFLSVGPMPLAIALGGTVAVLLHYKPQMHSAAGRLGEKDFRAVMQFVLITLVILPVLPNQAYGPFAVLNPFHIWLMVVLIVGISLAGYVAFKLLGRRAGTLAGGLLGGLISSTATTVSYARRSKEVPETSQVAAGVILIASTVVFGRVLVEVAAVAPGFLAVAATPIGVVMAVMGSLALVMLLRPHAGPAILPEPDNPTELKPALLFAGLYALVLLAVAAAKEFFGDRGMYAVAVLSGLTDMDAITLSVAQLVQQGGLAENTGWRLILVASMANMAFKAGMVAVLGSRALRGWVIALFSVALVVGMLVLWLWPG
jgi:uncharacterized membrane protein (DUF4010 family)